MRSFSSLLQAIGMGGLGYLEVLEDKSYKGPIDKFIPDDMKQEIADIAGLTAGRYNLLYRRQEKHRQLLYAGQIRTELGNRLDLIEKNAYRFLLYKRLPNV